MSSLLIPPEYSARLNVREVEIAIKDIKDFFERNLAEALDLVRVSAPLFVRSGTGLNDDLNGIERCVSFGIKDDSDAQAEIVQSLAKWKRHALARYEFAPGEGLYTDMNAIRPDEDLDNIHSLYVDQWDWEKVISSNQRNRETLQGTVRTIYDVICRTEFFVASKHSNIRPVLPAQITFVTSDELLERYPDLPPLERESRACAEHGAIFVIGIGGELANGQPHDGRAPDYDDWTTVRADGGRGLNGDIVVWNPILNRAFELSSMGIRVDAEALRRQLELSRQQERSQLMFHQMLLKGQLPQTMGGGIGQSRLCMFFLRTAHIGEVAVGIWPEEMERACREANVFLL